MEELSGLRSIEGFRSLAGPSWTAMEAANPRPSPDTGEKPVEEQASVNTDLEMADDMWDKRQIMYLFVLTSTIGLIFLLQPLLPASYSRWIIMVIAAVWGIGSIGLPFGMYGTSRCEKECSRHTGRLIYTLFSVFVIYGFYLAAMHTGDISAPTPSPSPSLQEGPASINKDTGGIVWFCVIGLIVLLGNIWSSIRGCWTGGDRDL